MSTTIEWTDETWNPVTGCTKVSQGCKNCYAETIANRFWGERKFTDVLCHEDRLEIPIHWRKPRRVFVNSMSDLFHPDVPFSFVDKVVAIMQEAYRHTFQILTKRPERMWEYFEKRLDGEWRFIHLDHAIAAMGRPHPTVTMFPFPNIWLGVSVEDQATANERIPWLLKTPAAVRFVSYEPALGPVNIWQACGLVPDSWFSNSGLDWIICGGESGPGARPMHPDWARSLRDQCVSAGVPFFFKQWGEWKKYTGQSSNTIRWMDNTGKMQTGDNNGAFPFARVGKKAAGRLLDGSEWNEYPEVHP
jgi:protein gp37